MESKKFINEQEKTRIYRNRDGGWSAETYVQIKGYAYMINTFKYSNGVIKCDAVELDDNSAGNGFVSVTYSPFSSKSYKLASLKAIANEKNIRQVHFEGLAKLDEMKDELPEKKTAYKIQPGQVIFLNGYGQDEHSHNRLIVYKVENETIHYVNEKTLEIGSHKEHSVKPIEKKFGIGIYYKQNDIVKDLDAVNNLVIEAYEKKKKFEAERPEREAKAAKEHQEAIAQIMAEYPYLKPIEKKWGGKYAAENIRIELKRHFPGVVFSVVTHNLDTVNIRWTNGPSRISVTKITNKYENHETDHSGDFRDYAPTLFTETFGGAKYVFEERNISDDIREKLMKQIHQQIHDDYEANRSFNVLAHENDFPETDFDIYFNYNSQKWQIKPQEEAILQHSEMVENSNETEPEEIFNDPNQLSIF